MVNFPPTTYLNLCLSRDQKIWSWEDFFNICYAANKISHFHSFMLLKAELHIIWLFMRTKTRYMWSYSFLLQIPHHKTTQERPKNETLNLIILHVRCVGSISIHSTRRFIGLKQCFHPTTKDILPPWSMWVNSSVNGFYDMAQECCFLLFFWRWDLLERFSFLWILKENLFLANLLFLKLVLSSGFFCGR